MYLTLSLHFDFHAFPTVNREPANREPEELPLFFSITDYSGWYGSRFTVEKE
jgi:hypothetical protein